MGYMCHHAILVTTWNDEYARTAHDKAKEILAAGLNDGPFARDWTQLLSPLISGIVNGEVTFMIAPDGSKEGWTDSDEGDRLRAEFVDWLDGERYDDDSTHFKWVLVQYGDEEADNRVLRDSDERYRRARADASQPAS